MEILGSWPTAWLLTHQGVRGQSTGEQCLSGQRVPERKTWGALPSSRAQARKGQVESTRGLGHWLELEFTVMRVWPHREPGDGSARVEGPG